MQPDGRSLKALQVLLSECTKFLLYLTMAPCLLVRWEPRACLGTELVSSCTPQPWTSCLSHLPSCRPTLSPEAVLARASGSTSTPRSRCMPR